MTTLAALFAALPLMLGWGEGSELRHPLGISIVGGLIVSQALTLFTTPVIYLEFDRLAQRLRPAAQPAQGRVRPAPRRGRSREAGPARMNLSAPFVRRPIGTVLLTIGVALAGIGGLLPPAGLAAAAGGFPDHLGPGASLPGASPETMATSVATPLEKHLGHHRRRQRNDLVAAGSARPTSPCSSAWTATSTAPRATCRRRSTRRASTCRPRCAPIPPIARSIPADAPIIILALTSKTKTPGQIYDAAANIIQQQLLAGARASATSISAAARCRRCASSSTRCAGAITASASRTSAPRWPRPTPTGPRA